MLRKNSAQVKVQNGKVGRPFGPIKPDVRRIPQVRVSRPVFHLVEYYATKYASARIFLQHLKSR